MLNYCVTSLVSIIFLIGCLMHLSENDIFKTKVIKRFRVLIYVIISEIAIDTIFASLEGRDVARFVLYLLKFSELSLNPIVSWLVFRIFYDEKVIKRYPKIRNTEKAMLMSIALNYIVLISGSTARFVFYIDKNNQYQRGDLVLLHVAIIIVTIILLIYAIMKFSNRTQSTMKVTLFAFMMILNTGIVLRALFVKSNYDFLCMAVSVSFLMLYYSHTSLRVDAVTHLLNRQVYQKILETVDYTTIAIVIDANNFKQINDTYGHEAGDRALKQLANAICEAYGKYAYCFRLGGDEFCAILKPGAFDRLIDETPNCDAYSMAEQLMGRLNKIIQDQIRDNPNTYLKDGISQGYGIYYSESNYPDSKENMTLKKVVKLADKRMYRNKELLKESGVKPESFNEHDFGRPKVIYEPSSTKLADTKE